MLYQDDQRKQKTLEHVYLAGSLVAIRERSLTSGVYATKYQHTDALGSPVAASDQSGQVIERTQWEPYGAAINRTIDGIGYAGHVMDAATGLTYMQQRYYDPSIGRFLSVDPIGVSPINGLNFNRYWYASNNPYKNTDPDGRCDGPSTFAIDRDIAAMNRGDMSPGEFMDRSEARAAGAVAGVAIVVAPVATLRTARWMLTTPKGRAVALAIMHRVAKNGDDLEKLGTRVQEAAVKEMKAAEKAAAKEVKEVKTARPPEPPKPSGAPNPSESPKPTQYPKPEK